MQKKGIGMKNEFETRIDRFIKEVNSKGYGFGWKNHPHRLNDGAYIEGEPFDYTICCKNGKVLVFDAKALHSKTWKLLPKDIRQCQKMLKVNMNNNCKTFFIVYFYIYKCYRIIDAVDVTNILMGERKTIRFEEMEEIKLEFLVK